MRNVPKLAAVLVLFGASAWIGIDVLGPALMAPPVKELPPLPKLPGLPVRLRQRIAEAGHLEVPAVLRVALEQYRGNLLESEVRELAAGRARRALDAVTKEAGGLLENYRYASAAKLFELYRRAWTGTSVSAAVKRRLEELREEQQAQVEGRIKEADAMLDMGRYEPARETLETRWEFEATYREQLSRHRKEVENYIRARAGVTGQPAPGPGPSPQPVPAAPPRAVLALPPALPGYPHPDIKRLSEARALLAKAKSLFGSRRYIPAAKALGDLVGYYGDLAYIDRNRDAVEAMRQLARHGTEGVKGLFHATSVKAKGRRVTLKYEFKSEGEQLDWEELMTIPHQRGGEFRPARGGVRGTDGTSYALNAFFQNDVRMRCNARIQKLRSHGLVFCQQDLETRQVMLIVTNHKIVEGENYVKQRPGHSLIMWGKGTNNDVPLDSPDTGFIFKGASRTDPSPPAGATITLTFSVKGDNMEGTVSYKGDATKLTHHTKGDDGRSIEKLRPTLFVLENGVLFSEIVITGTLHPRFERARIDELLDLASMSE